jgi:AraC-like DNA-binding protein
VKLYFKYMVSQRCKMLVTAELDRLGIEHDEVELGWVLLPGDVSADKLEQLRLNLLPSGLELLDDKRNILVESVKNLIIEMIHYSDEVPKENYSALISRKIGLDYTYLSNIFSEIKGITIQQFIINHKIERVKELILYDQLSLTEIAYKMHYSSVAHLSNQFKKVTGLTPSFFKNMKAKRMIQLENL